MTSELKQVLMNRDKISAKDADDQISEMRESIMEGEDPEEVLMGYGLEMDYFFDLI